MLSGHAYCANLTVKQLTANTVTAGDVGVGECCKFVAVEVLRN